MRWGRIIGILGILLILLSLRFFTFFKNQAQFKVGEKITLRTTLLSEPQIRGKVQYFYVNNILVTVPRFPEYYYGQKLIMTGTLEGRVLSNKKQVLALYFPKIENQDSTGILALSSFIRQKMSAVFKKTLSSPYDGLLMGIVLGFKENLSEKLLESLRISGTLHIVAASGMNVTMVGSFLSSLFLLFLRRQIAFIFSILGIFFYALLSGLEPSIVRAAIMGAIAYSALILGRQNLALLSLFLAGYLMLFFSPKNLFDVGFQLSFLATLGLITLKPLFENLKLIERIKNYQIGNDLTTTLSAQIATLPVLLINFGSYSPPSIIANTLVLWTIPLLMILGGVAAMFSLFLEVFARFVLILALPFLFFFEKAVLFFASLGTQILTRELPAILVLGYYLGLLSLILFFRRQSV